MTTKNIQLTSSRKVGMRDINAALLSAPISRIKTLRDDEGRKGFTQNTNVGQVLPDNFLNNPPSSVLIGHLPPHGEAANFNAPSTWRERAECEAALAVCVSTGVRGKNACGFTLIELLVVVLIIGILAAIALPQYQKAVEKSKAIQALTLLKAVHQAQSFYYLNQGNLPRSFDTLDIDLSSWTGNTKWLNNADALATRSNPDWSLQLTSKGIYIGRISGSYKGAGFMIYTLKNAQMDPHRLLCAERISNGVTFDTSKHVRGDYCEKIWKASSIGQQGTVYAYYMP